MQILKRRNFIKNIGIGSFMLLAPFIMKLFPKTCNASENNHVVLKSPLKTGNKLEPKNIINDVPINIKPELEQISIVVEIGKICDDFSHPGGFQIIINGKSYGAQSNFDVDIVNDFKPDEKSRVDELILKVTPGTSWLITGEPLIFMEYEALVLFDSSYQMIQR